MTSGSLHYRGMWNIAGVPMVVSKWTPRTEKEKQEEESIPMWVRLKRVPLHMFSWEALSFISSAVWFPVRLHPETIACTNFEVAKVFVNVDVSKALPKEINFSKDGKEFVIEFSYPWLPSICNHCDKWGHLEKLCVLKGKNKEQADSLSSKKVGNEDQKKQEMKQVVERQSSEVAAMEGESEAIVISENADNVELVNNKVRKEDNWSRVSPTKAGRS